MKGGVKVCELVEHLGLAVVNKGADFETALVGIRDVNRPGLQLVGYTCILCQTLLSYSKVLFKPKDFEQQGGATDGKVSNSADSACLYQTARVTLPERRHRVQTYTWRGVPSTIAFTRLTLGFHVRLDRLWEWDTLIPKVTPLSQN